MTLPKNNASSEPTARAESGGASTSRGMAVPMKPMTNPPKNPCTMRRAWLGPG